MNITEVKNNQIEQQGKSKPNYSNLTDLELRLKISNKEETLAQLESKHEKTKEEFNQLGKLKEEFKFLLQQSNIPFRITNTIWFNRTDSIFFSIKNNPISRMTF